MYEKLIETVLNLGSPRVLLVGDFMLDVYVYGDALRISPEAPVPVLKVTGTEFACGGAGSVAADLAALGAVPVCIGIIGKDESGQKIKKILRDMGAHIEGLITSSDRPTTTKQRLIGLAQHRHRQQLMRIDQESTQPLSEQELAAVLQAYRNNLNDADIVCLQDYDKGVLGGDSCEKMIAAAKATDKMVLVDPAFTSQYSKYGGATLITPNRKEASAAVGFELTNTSGVTRAAQQLLEQLSLAAVVITLDKEGAYLKTRQIDKHVPTRPRSVYDVTGAGDIILATLSVALAAGCDYETAVKLSNIAGGIEVEKFGSATVTTEEIVAELVHENQGELGKVRSIDSVLAEINWHRSQKNKIVFTNGCFDVVHRGHIEFLKFCKAQGDVVVLGLNSDRSVKQIKGPDRPINDQHDRATVLSALETVDYIVIFDEPDPLDLIKKVRPDILVKGKDWQNKGVVGQEFVESIGGKVVLAPLVEGRSSSSTIEKIKSLYSRPEAGQK